MLVALGQILGPITGNIAAQSWGFTAAALFFGAFALCTMSASVVLMRMMDYRKSVEVAEASGNDAGYSPVVIEMQPFVGGVAVRATEQGCELMEDIRL